MSKSKSNNIKGNININNIDNRLDVDFSKEGKLGNYFGKNLNIFNISFEEDEKNNIYLENFLSNNNLFDELLEDNQNLNDKNINKNNIINEETNINNINNKIVDEIVSILRTPLNKKNINCSKTPFIPLLRPIRISLNGKIIINNKYE